jgi:hypothetical protein
VGTAWAAAGALASPASVARVAGGGACGFAVISVAALVKQRLAVTAAVEDVKDDPRQVRCVRTGHERRSNPRRSLKCKLFWMSLRPSFILPCFILPNFSLDDDMPSTGRP